MVSDASSSVQLCAYVDLISSPLGPQVAVAGPEAHRCDLLIFSLLGVPNISLPPLLSSSPACPPSCRQAYVYTSHLLLLLLVIVTPEKMKAFYIRGANMKPSSCLTGALQ
ncbi:hypothetical protein XENOCAPTIV_010198 [Xenoophorus captivus]|uniref:Uncharacterized protein n=1 Tax=Xenoophorus captivus TaxID=1517983 RepID=A0ABV0QR12_9TELE